MLPSIYHFSLLLLHLFLFASTYIVSSSSAKIGQGYKLTYIEEAPDGGFIGLLQLKQETSIYGPDIRRLQLYVKHETEDRLRVHITDAEEVRWEVPYNLLPREKPPSLKSTIGNKLDTSKDSQFSGNELVFSYIPDPFSFAVKRKSNGETLFNSTSDDTDSYSSLVFKDQYLEISTKLPSTASLYGLGENTQPKGIKLQPHDPYTLYTTDISAINLNIDLYGSHPVYMDLRNDGRGANAHAVLLLNSNGMDVFYTGKSLTYKVIGGVLDFYFFSGSTPLKVVDQYTSFAGRPAPMPYWALGFHQCRWGYRNVSQLESVVKGYRKANIPLDVMWTDDDHMDAAKDFTIDPINFPRQKFLPFVENLHANGLHYIVLIDPGIAVNQSYGVFRRGLADDVFIKHDGAPFLAQVWPGPVYFPDYLNPATVSWWADEIRRFHELIPVDGLWIDMNEVSNFCTGQCKIPTDHPCPGTGQPWDCCLDCVNITKTRWDEPPYKINASGVSAPLGFKTIATSATHYNGVLEYNAHSLYGFTMAIATNKALLALQGKRPFVLSRSTFVGSGRYAAHWTGDNKGTWEDLGYSISTILNFGMFGVPMVGADICGFYPSYGTPPLEELCNRWIELGAFYPFSRDHANLHSPSQELYVWESVATSARNALGLRYKLLPYFYTLNYEAHTTGAPIARPLFFNFPNFVDCYNVSTQFMLGRSVLVSPVLKKAATSVKAMFPPGSWYNLFDMSKAVLSKSGHYLTLDAPLHVVNVHLYQNNILPMQRGGLTSKEARTTPYSLVVTFPAGATSAEARGELFVDEDELPEMSIAAGQSTYVEFYATLEDKQVKVWSVVTEPEYAMEKGWSIEKVTVLGLEGHGGELEVEVDDGVALKNSAPVFADVTVRHADELEGGNYRKGMMVEIGGLELPLGKKFSMTWKMSIQQ